ncbi:MAG: CHAT domain-containing protein [Cyanobacteria bacterium P01_F01_bin.150]
MTRQIRGQRFWERWPQAKWLRWFLLFAIGFCLSVTFYVTTNDVGYAQVKQPAPTRSSTPLNSFSDATHGLNVQAHTPTTLYSLIQSGKDAYHAQRYAEASIQLQQAIEIYETMGVDASVDDTYRASHAQVLALQSLVQQKLGNWDTAQTLIDQSLILMESLPSPPLRIRAQALNAQGHLYFATGQAQWAFNSWDAAEQDYVAIADQSGQIGSQINQIQALESIGAYYQASQRLDQISSKLDTFPDSTIKVTGLLNLGNMLRLRGELIRSHDRLIAGLTTAQTLNLSSLLSPLYLNLGNTERVMAARAITLNRLTDAQAHRQAALDYYENAIRFSSRPTNNTASLSSSSNPLPNPAERQPQDLNPNQPQNRTLNKIEAQLNQLSLLLERDLSSGPVEQTIANLQPSPESLSNIQRLIPQIETELPQLIPSRRSVYVQVNFAHSLIVLHGKTLNSIRIPDIAVILETAIAQAQSLQDQRAIAYATGILGHWQEINHQWTAAKQATSTALKTAQQIQAADIAYQWQWQMGRIIQAETDNRDRQIPEFSENSGISATIDISNDGLRFANPSYVLQNPKSKVQNFPGSANPTAIRYYTGAVNTLNTLRSDLVALNPDIQFSFREQVEPVYRELVGLLLRDPSAKQDQLRQARDVIEALQLAELDNFFRDACAQPQSVDISTVDPNTAVLYPILLPDTTSGQRSSEQTDSGQMGQRLEVVLQLPPESSDASAKNHPNSADSSAAPRLIHIGQTLSERQVTQVAEMLRRDLRKLSTPTGQIKAQSQQLYDWLIRPFEAELERSLTREDSAIKTLAFVLDGPLRNLPMAVLHNGEEYLVERYAIALTPGLQLLDSQPLQRQDLKVLLGGAVDAPSFKSFAFGRLDNVDRELDRISVTVADSEVLQNQTFLKDNIQTEIEDTPFNVVHLATHGNFSSDPEQTFILDWQQPIFAQDMDALLHINNPRRAIEKPIELLILSACETAAGDSRAALGLAGIAIRAGARSTLATLWQVNDASTAEFMVQFYQELANPNVTKAEALRNVQLSFLKADSQTRFNRPNRWAPFILVGNWR